MYYNLHSYFPVLSSLQPHRVWQEDRPARSLHSEVRSSVGKISGQLHLRTMDRAFDCSKGNHFELTTIVVKLYQLTHSCSMKPCECIFSHYRGITVSHLQYLTSNILKTKLTIIPENFHVEKREDVKALVSNTQSGMESLKRKMIWNFVTQTTL